MVGCEGSDGRITLYLNNVSTGAFISGTLRVCGVNYTIPTGGYTLWYRADSGEFYAPDIPDLNFHHWMDEYGKERVENPMTQRLHPGAATFTVAFYEVPPVPPVKKPAWGLLGVLGFVAAVMGVAYISDRSARRISSSSPGAESCPRDEETVQVWLRKISDHFNSRNPTYTFKAGEVCPPMYEACITYPEPIHFKCGHVSPGVVGHEYGHWLAYQMGSPYYGDEDLIEDFAQATVKRLSGIRLKRVSGLPSPVCWPGGKRLLTKELMKRVPSHNVYVEAFAGGAPLFFEKEPAEVNVLNDLDPELMNFYRQFRELQSFDCDMTPNVWRFRSLLNKKNKTPCDFFYVNKWSFSCNMTDFSPSKRFGEKCIREDPSKCYMGKPTRFFQDYKRRLQKAVLENRDFREVLTQYDSPETFFYLDPPYWEPNMKECLYREFCGVNPEQVAEAVRGLKGKVLISYDNHPKVRQAFEGFKTETVEMPYSMEKKKRGSKGRRKLELLISNYD